MAGLIEEGKDILVARAGCDASAWDAALIAAAQKIEHYEISAYGSCRAQAEQLGLTHAAELLQETLNEENNADAILTQITSGINAVQTTPIPSEGATMPANARGMKKSSRSQRSGSAQGSKKSATASRSGGSGAARGSGKRERISPRGDARFVRRDGDGKFSESDDVGRSLSADRRRKAKTKVKSGYGDRGDRGSKAAKGRGQ